MIQERTIENSNQNQAAFENTPQFTGRNVPIAEIAAATGKEAQFIRIGLQQGFLHFGTAFRNPGSSIYSYFCPDKKVWEELGYFNPDPPKRNRQSRER